MGDAIITRRGGGITKAYALIHVTYPTGSTCTCTKGTRTLSAKDTSGEYLFLIPESGTWTVSCTDGTETNSQNVVIDHQYQAENIVLSYSIFLIDGANYRTEGFYKNSDYIQIVGGTYSGAPVTELYSTASGYWVVAWGDIDLSGRSIVELDGFFTDLETVNNRLCVWENSVSSPTYGNALVYSSVPEYVANYDGTLNLSISLTGTYKVGWAWAGPSPRFRNYIRYFSIS